MSNRQIDEKYWMETMHHRQKEIWEIERLISVAKGHYLDELKYEAECEEKDTISLKEYSLSYFVEHAKRPFGNKNIEHSIIFNLGWDWDRRLETESAPQWVEDEANRIYGLVIKEIKENEELEKSYKLLGGDNN